MAKRFFTITANAASPVPLGENVNDARILNNAIKGDDFISLEARGTYSNGALALFVSFDGGNTYSPAQNASDQDVVISANATRNIKVKSNVRDPQILGYTFTGGGGGINVRVCVVDDQ